MTKYIISVTDPTIDEFLPPVHFELPCDTLEDLEKDLRSFTRWVEYGVTLEVFRFNDESLDYELIDAIRA